MANNNLPANLTIFDRIRNRVVKAALNNNAIRTVMARTMPDRTVELARQNSIDSYDSLVKTLTSLSPIQFKLKINRISDLIPNYNTFSYEEQNEVTNTLLNQIIEEASSQNRKELNYYILRSNLFNLTQETKFNALSNTNWNDISTEDIDSLLQYNTFWGSQSVEAAYTILTSVKDSNRINELMPIVSSHMFRTSSRSYYDDKGHTASDVLSLASEEVRFESIKNYIENESFANLDKDCLINALSTISKESRIQLYPAILKNFDSVEDGNIKNDNYRQLFLSIQDTDEKDQIFEDIYSRINLKEIRVYDYVPFIEHMTSESLQKYHNELIKTGLEKLQELGSYNKDYNNLSTSLLDSFDENSRFDALINFVKEGNLSTFERIAESYFKNEDLSDKFVNYLIENNIEIPTERIIEYQNNYQKNDYITTLSETFKLFNKYCAQLPNEEDKHMLVNAVSSTYRAEAKLNLYSNFGEEEIISVLNEYLKYPISIIKDVFSKEKINRVLKSLLVDNIDESRLDVAKYFIKNLNSLDIDGLKQEDIDAGRDKYASIYKNQLDTQTVDPLDISYNHKYYYKIYLNLLSQKGKALAIIEQFNNLDLNNRDYIALNRILIESNGNNQSFKNIQLTIEKYGLKFMSDEKFEALSKEGLVNGFVKYFYGLQIANEGRYDEAIDLINDTDVQKAYIDLFKKIPDDQKLEKFGKLSKSEESTRGIFFDCDADLRKEILKHYIFDKDSNIDISVNLFKSLGFMDLLEYTEKSQQLPREYIHKLIEKDKSISTKVLLFDSSVDRNKIIELQQNNQLTSSTAIDINSVLSSIYNDTNISIEEFNDKLDDIYRIFTYNNIPNFLKTFRLFQVGNFYNKTNFSLVSIQNKTPQERDELFLGDLFRISLDSNDKSLRDFATILNEGKRITTVLQRNPEEMISKLSEEELAVLYQYRDTIFDLHNFTKEVKGTDKQKLKPSDNLVEDLRNIVAVYNGNSNSHRNVVFDAHKILDELMGSYVSDQIRPRAILEYMDNSQKEANERHKKHSEAIKNGELHLEDGDFIKGIRDFDKYITSMLAEGVKGGEFNREFSHSDGTPLDADFGYITPYIKKDGKTDAEIIVNTISGGYGSTYIVMKNYKERLDARDDRAFNNGTLATHTDYYGNENSSQAAYYIRTGIGVNDIDYIVSREWQPRFGYEMAMAGKFIPVKNAKDELIFSQEDYDKIREQMKGLSYYEAEPFVVDEKVTRMEPLYALYRSVSKKSKDETEKEIQTVKDMIAGKEDTVTKKKKLGTLELIQSYFKDLGIKVTDNLGMNLSSNAVELIDTGSTGRGTNVPGDGDFDFMLRHNTSQQVLTDLQSLVLSRATGEKVIVGDGFRSKGVILPNGEKADIDVTCAKKNLKLEYSSDMCVKDRLHSIEEEDPKKLPYVKANIIMAKKILKAMGIYKKLGSDGATKYGGFGGIGVENWVLQNGGSFEQAMTTYLEAAEKSATYDSFIQQYPIFDFGNNQRDSRGKHDRFSAFLDEKEGFVKVKQSLRSNLDYMHGIRTPLQESLSPEGFNQAIEHKKTLRRPFAYTKTLQMIAKMKTRLEHVKVNDRDESPKESEVEENGERE